MSDKRQVSDCSGSTTEMRHDTCFRMLTIQLRFFRAMKSLIVLTALVLSIVALPAAASGQSVSTVATVAPAFSPQAGTYHSAQSVTISDSSTNATIYYTLDGSTPTTASAVYNGPLTVSNNTPINATAGAASPTASSAATAMYVSPAATVTFQPGSGTYALAQSVA